MQRFKQSAFKILTKSVFFSHLIIPVEINTHNSSCKIILWYCLAQYGNIVFKSTDVNCE